MKKLLGSLGLAALMSAVAASPCFAAPAAPAPLLGSGLPGLAVLVVAGGGYLAVRKFRRGRE